MAYPDFEIKPQYFFKSIIKLLSFTIAVGIIVNSILNSDYHMMVLSIFFFLITIFTFKRELIIYKGHIVINTIGSLSFLNNTTKIELDEIQKVIYNEREIEFLKLIFRGVSLYASPEDHRPNKRDNIIFKLKNDKTIKVFKIGSREDFKKAFSLIDKKVKQHQ